MLNQYEEALRQVELYQNELMMQTALGTRDILTIQRIYDSINSEMFKVESGFAKLGELKTPEFIVDLIIHDLEGRTSMIPNRIGREINQIAVLTATELYEIITGRYTPLQI